SVEEMAAGFVRVGDELVAQAIREESVLRGYDVRTHALVAFGGAGPQHAFAVARALGVTKVIVPRLASVLSAWGIAGAREADEQVHPLLRALDVFGLHEAGRHAHVIWAGDLQARVTLELRVRGADATLVVPIRPTSDLASVRAAFEAAHRSAYGFGPPTQADLEIVNLRVRVEKGDAPASRAASSGRPIAER